MATSDNQPNNSVNEDNSIANIRLRPTLFIGIGGTGMEVLLRVRRRILNNLWGPANSQKKVESLAKFPVAQFMQIDLDNNSVIETGKAQTDDLQFNLIKFTDEEKIVEKFSIDSYSKDDSALDTFPHVKEWLPLTPKKIKELNIDPSKGAGQIRSISRLYFFDKYNKIKDKLTSKLVSLRTGLSHVRTLQELGLRMEETEYRIVVVCSIAGGTGSGSFLDMGWLARVVAKTLSMHANVELMLFLPTGFASANKSKTEANGYAALMELEAAMRGNKGYVGKWDNYDNFHNQLDDAPYSEVFLINSANLTNQATNNIQDIYNMLADALFEDFASVDFVRRKRSVAVNQQQFKNQTHFALLPATRFADMRLSYSKRYSSLGQSVLDTKQDTQRDIKSILFAKEMLTSYFGINEGSSTSRRADITQTKDFLAKFLNIVPKKITLPQISEKSAKNSQIEFNDYDLVYLLLSGRKNETLNSEIISMVTSSFINIKALDSKQWEYEITKALSNLENIAQGNQDSTGESISKRIALRGKEILSEKKTEIANQFNTYLDKEDCGLEYVLTLIQQINDEISNKNNGLIKELELNKKQYQNYKELLKSLEYKKLLKSLSEVQGYSIFKDNAAQRQIIIAQIEELVANIINYDLYATAAQETIVLLQNLSSWLGEKISVDNGLPISTGLLAEYENGKKVITNVIEELLEKASILQTELEKEYPTLTFIPNTEKVIYNLNPKDLRSTANQVIKDFRGAKNFFNLLLNPSTKETVTLALKQNAEKIIIENNGNKVNEDTISNTDPLFVSLDKMSSENRMEIFRTWITCSMPWVAANLAGTFSQTFKSDQYKCFIGVSDETEFKDRYGLELKTCMPAQASISADQLNYVTTGIKGKAVCYTEISGIPLTIIQGMETWRSSYVKESENIPLHTHKDKTQFSHPIAPSSGEINELADEFKYYLLAVMTGILKRSLEVSVPKGQYQFSPEIYEYYDIGNERAIRQNGLVKKFKSKIIERVDELLNGLSFEGFVVLAALAKYYEKAVYTPVKVKDENGAEDDVKGFACVLSGELSDNLLLRADAKAKAKGEIITGQIYEKYINQLITPDNFTKWATPILDSEQDVYEWEVRPPMHSGKLRYKYEINQVLLTESSLRNFFNKNAIEVGTESVYPVNNSTSSQQTVITYDSNTRDVVPPPPRPKPPRNYYLIENDQQSGPFNQSKVKEMLLTREVTFEAKVWYDGLSDWVDLSELKEFIGVLEEPEIINLPPPFKK